MDAEKVAHMEHLNNDICTALSKLKGKTLCRVYYIEAGEYKRTVAEWGTIPDFDKADAVLIEFDDGFAIQLGTTNLLLKCPTTSKLVEVGLQTEEINRLSPQENMDFGEIITEVTQTSRWRNLVGSPVSEARSIIYKSKIAAEEDCVFPGLNHQSYKLSKGSSLDLNLHVIAVLDFTCAHRVYVVAGSYNAENVTVEFPGGDLLIFFDDHLLRKYSIDTNV